MNEFELIKKYFFHHPARQDVVVKNGDDCAVLQTPSGYELAMSMDTLVENVHFDKSFSAKNIGYKSLAVNLSDLAAMGATPAWTMLSLTLPNVDEQWLRGFRSGFFELLKLYSLDLIGGDITQGPLSITVHVAGLLPAGAAIKRSGAQVGDAIYVTHELGDAVLALDYLHHKKMLSNIDSKKMLKRLYRPTPRIEVGIALRGIANSAIDISDGLYGDLQHILQASHVGASIFIDKIPTSLVLKKQEINYRRTAALHSGDAYELCFTAPKKTTLPTLPCKITCIGEITDSNKIMILDNEHNPLSVTGNSFSHF